MRSPRGWFDRRVHHTGLHGNEHTSNQRRIALFATFFSGIRVIGWFIALVLMGMHFVFPHTDWLTTYYHVCQTVAFVTFLSLYCNFATDLSALMASVAALFSADSHRDVEHVRRLVGSGLTDVEADIARLATLDPGPEAEKLVIEIKTKLG